MKEDVPNRLVKEEIKQDLVDKTFNVQANLLLHILRWHVFDTLYCMNHDREETEKQMNYHILGRSHVAPFSAIPSTSKPFSLTFNFTKREGGVGGVDIKH